jgi:hypothetical protein
MTFSSASQESCAFYFASCTIIIDTLCSASSVLFLTRESTASMWTYMRL